MTRRLARLSLSRTDAIITAAVVAWGIAEAIGIEGQRATGVRLAFVLAATLPMVLRNRYPLALLGFAAAVFAFEAIPNLMPLQAVTPIQLLPLTTYAAASGGAFGRQATLFGAGCVLVPLALFLAFVHDAPVTVTDVVSLTVTQGAAVLAGLAAHRRRLEAARQAAQLRRLHESADERLHAGLEAERLRLARELRAIVARTLAAMEQRLAGAATAPPRALAAAASEIQARAAGAMDELQRLLAVLHDRPGVVVPATIESAAEAARARGWTVALDGPQAEATPGATLAAGRVLEELLAGAPAGAAAVRVSVTTRGGGLRVRAGGAGEPPPALADPVARGSLRERVRLHGGTLRTRAALRRWRVDVVLPAGATADAGRRSSWLGDLVVTGVAALIVLDDVPDAPDATAMAVGGALAFVLPLAVRRRFPLAAPLVIGAGLLALEVGDVFPELTRAPLVMAMLGAGSAALQLADPRRALTATAAVAAPALAANWLQQTAGEPPTDSAIILFLVAMAYGFGRLVREQREHAIRSRAGEESAAAELGQRLQDAVNGERRAVARDLHDVVAHGVSLIGVLAGAADAQAAHDAERARASLLTARDSIAQVRVELERLTAALATPGSPEPAALGLADLQRLVDDARQGGQQVELRLEPGAAASVQPGVAVSAYRIAQEALTNARKHATGAAVVVCVERGDRHLTVDVRNDPPPGDAHGGGTGNGLAGMRERARLLGGDLSAGATPAGGFQVTAQLPLAAEATAGG